MDTKFRGIVKSVLCGFSLIFFLHYASFKKQKSPLNNLVSEKSFNENISDKVNTSDYGNTPFNLSDLLERVSGMQISGSDNNITIKVLGAQSFGSGMEPLFVNVPSR